MNNIDKLIEYIIKQDKLDVDVSVPPISGITPASGSGGVPTPKVKSPSEMIPSEQRLYLDKEGKIPGTNKTAQELKLFPYPGILNDDENAMSGTHFIDKRTLQIGHPSVYDDAHGPKHGTPNYGGIVINENGEILVRTPKGEGFGNKYTFAKGSANKGETPEEASLREVKEETGIIGNIIGEVPGHYSSDNKDNKYFLMEVSEDTGKLDDETESIQWLSPEKAMDLLKTGEDSTKAKRDIHALRAALHKHKSLNTEKVNIAKLERLNKKRTKYSLQLIKDLLNHIEEKGSLPTDFSSAPEYRPLLREFATHTGSVDGKFKHATYNDINGLAGKIFQSMDVHAGYHKSAGFGNTFAHIIGKWKGNAIGNPGNPSSGDTVTNAVNNIVAEKFGIADNYAYGTMIPTDVDSGGTPIFRTDDQRDEIIKAWDNYRDNILVTFDDLNEAQKDSLDTIDKHFSSLTDLEGYSPDIWQINDDILKAKIRGVPDYMIKDAVRKKISEKLGLTKIGDIKSKIKELKLAGVPTTKTPATGESASHVKGEYSWGEKYDFSESRDVEIHGEVGFSPTVVNGWKLQAERARASKATRSKGELRQKLEEQDDIMIRQGKQVAAQQAGVSPNHMGHNTLAVKEASKDKTDDELRDLGRSFYRDFTDRTYNLTQQLLKSIYVDIPMESGDHPTTHLYAWRTANSPREIMGDIGLSGSKEVQPSQLRAEGMPDPSEEKENEDGYSKRIHSHALTGYSFSPRFAKTWKGSYVIGKKVNIRDIFLPHSLIGVSDYNDEREMLIINRPSSPTRVIHKDGNIMDGNSWSVSKDGQNGYRPDGLYGPDVVSGLTNPSVDYANELTHEGGSLGTNNGGSYSDSDGKKYYVKYDEQEGKNASENLANKLYEAAGIDVPHTEIVNFDGQHVLKSDWLDKLTPHGQSANGEPPTGLADHPDIKSGFLVDAVLANHDVVGSGPEAPYHNIQEHEGKMIRLDQGGALEFRGLSQDKKSQQFHNPGAELGELKSLRDGNLNKQTAHIFKNMTSDDWKNAVSKLGGLTNSKIEDIVNSSAIHPKEMNKMIKTLKGRRDSAFDFVVKNSPEIGYNSIDDIHGKYKIQKMVLLKEVNKELEALKNRRDWIIEPHYRDIENEPFSDEAWEEINHSYSIT